MWLSIVAQPFTCLLPEFDLCHLPFRGVASGAQFGKQSKAAQSKVLCRKVDAEVRMIMRTRRRIDWKLPSTLGNLASFFLEVLRPCRD